MWNLDKGAKLSVKVQQDLMQRSKQGVWAHPLCMILVAVTTGLLDRARLVMVMAMVAAVVQAALRLALVKRLHAVSLPRPRHIERMHVGLLLSCAALWGTAPGITIYLFGYHDRDVLMLLLYHAVVAFGTVNLLVHSRRLIVVALGLLFAPLVVGHLLSREPQVLNYLSAAVMYLAYCLVQGKKLNHCMSSRSPITTRCRWRLTGIA